LNKNDLKYQVSLLSKSLMEKPKLFDSLFETVKETLFPGSKISNQLKHSYDMLAILGETLLQNETAREELTIAKSIDDLGNRAIILAKNIATSQAHSGDINGAKICFELAIITSRLIESSIERDEVLDKIIDQQVEALFFENSKSNAKYLSDVYSRSRAFERIAVAQAQKGEFDDAINTSAEIGDIDIRARAYASVAEEQASYDHSSAAKRTFKMALSNANQIEDSFDRFVLFSKIAEGQAIAGMVEDALVTASSIDDGFEYSRTLASIAEKQSHGGDQIQAKALFNKAIKEAEKLQDYNNFLPFTLAYIVEKMLEVNEVVGATEILGRISEPTAQSEALIRLAEKQSELDLINDARDTFINAFNVAKSIGDNFYRPELLAKIIDRMAKVKLFSEALELTTQIESESDRITAYASIAMYQASSNLFDEAKHTLRRVTIPHLRLSALSALSINQASCGLFADSLQTAQQIQKTDALYDKTVSFVAEKMGEAHDFKGAVRTAQLLDSLYTRAELLGSIACKQKSSGEEDGAQRCFEMAITTASQINAEYNRFVISAQIEKCWKEVHQSVQINPPEMYHVDQAEPSDRFKMAWQSAGVHIQQLGSNGLVWLRTDLHLPMAEHLSFRLGNQLFFIFVEAAEYNFIERKSLFLEVSKEANAIPCVISMVEHENTFTTSKPGWGFVHAETNQLVNPSDLVSSELIEMSDWELHDFAIQVVKNSLEKEGKKIFAVQSALNIDPSIWFEEKDENYWVVVRSARFPKNEAPIPANIDSIKASCASKGKAGFFASVGVVPSPTSNNPNSGGILYRGQGMHIKFSGLKSL
jgi:tetratricopeptide (TPR) repeat protein